MRDNSCILDGLKRVFGRKRKSDMDNEEYKKVGLGDEQKGGGYKSGGITGKNVKTKTVKRSVAGLGMPSKSLRAIKEVMKLSALLPRIANDNGADAMIQISFFVDKGKKGTPVFDKYKMSMSAKLKEYKAGRGKVTYGFAWSGDIFNMKKAVTSTLDISGADKGSVDVEKYDKALMDIIAAVTDLYGYDLGVALKK